MWILFASTVCMISFTKIYLSDILLYKMVESIILDLRRFYILKNEFVSI